MPERLLIDTDVLRTAAGRFDWSADDLDRGLQRLRDGLAALGDVCGPDEGGRAFAADHDAARRRIETAVANVTACARGIARGLQATADNVDRAEHASTVTGAGSSRATPGA